jgi:PAS domain S-box-containing protein
MRIDVPMVHVERLIGFLGFSCVRNKRDWTDDEIALLQLVGQVITNALHRKNAEARITRAKQEWEQTFDAVHDLISIFDNEYRIVQANKALAGKLGCSAEELIGRSCYEVTHGTDRPPAFCPHAQVLTDGNDHVAEVHEDRLGGDFLVSVSPLYDQDGKLRGSVHVARDITRPSRLKKLCKRRTTSWKNAFNNGPPS